MKSLEEIVLLQRQREVAQGPVLSQMREVGQAFSNELIVPLPELDRNERSSVPNLIQQGITAKAQRISQVLPNLDYPVVRLGIKLSEEASRHRRMANLGWWEFGDMELVLGRRARHLLAYTTAPVKVSPNFALGIPRWSPVDPLTAFPAPARRFDEMRPADMIVATTGTVGALKADYPDRMAWAVGVSPDTAIKLIEYCDDDERVLVATGEASGTADVRAAMAGTVVVTAYGSASGPRYAGSEDGRGFQFMVELDRQVNRAGVCWFVTPGSISLDKPVNRYAAMIGTHLAAAKLQALEMLGVHGGVLPKTYFVQTEAQGGIIAQATAGQLGHVKGGKLETIHVEPSLRPDNALDRYERSMRIDGGIPVATSGEQQSGVRTGRLSDSLLGAALDPDVAESQRIFARSLQYENEVAVAVAKGYAPDRPVAFHVNWKGARGPVTYTAGDLFADGYAPSVVSYPIVGADEQQLVVGGGQRLGLGTLSKWEFMELDPMVKDREFTHDRIIAEGLESALLQGLQQQAAAGSMSPADLARIAMLVSSDRKELAEAITMVHEQAQARQASNGPPGTPEGPVAPGSPEAQPGLAAGTPAAPGAVAPTIGAEGPSEQNLMNLLRSARMVRSQQRAS